MGPRRSEKVVYGSIGAVSGVLGCLLAVWAISDNRSLPSQPPRLHRLEVPAPKQELKPYTHCKTEIKPVFDYVKESLNNPNASVITTSLDLKTFECTAREAGTVKVIEHMYEFFYAKYLGPVRLQPLRLLAIGLGCNMGYGPGHSLELWKRYLPNSAISFIEINKECAEPFRAKIEATGGRLYVGSQEGKEVMEGIVQDSQKYGLLDVVSDDGALFPDVQQRTLEGIWSALKPGGVYIVEDVWRHFEPDFENRTDTFIPRLKHVMDMIQCRTVWRTGFKRFSPSWNKACEAATEFDKQVMSVECSWEACAIVKHVHKGHSFW